MHASCANPVWFNHPQLFMGRIGHVNSPQIVFGFVLTRNYVLFPLTYSLRYAVNKLRVKLLSVL